MPATVNFSKGGRIEMDWKKVAMGGMTENEYELALGLAAERRAAQTSTKLEFADVVDKSETNVQAVTARPCENGVRTYNYRSAHTCIVHNGEMVVTMYDTYFAPFDIIEMKLKYAKRCGIIKHYTHTIV